MADSNRLRLSYVEEATLGTTPGSPAMREILPTGESLDFAVDFTESKQIRSDRQTVDTLQVGAKGSGGIPFELTFPGPRYWLRDFLRLAFFASAWSEMPEIYNLTSDSSITAVTDSSDTYTVASGGASFKANHLVRASGFTNSNNNRLYKVASSTGTTVVAAGTPSLTDEAAPPAGARLKVVGFEAAGDDIVATSTGLTSTLLDFTTLGLMVGQWIKPSGFTVATLNNGWARIASIAAGALVFDNRPTGWATDSGASQTIRCYVGDVLRNGTTKKSATIEKGFMDLAVPEYMADAGLVAGQLSLSVTSKEIITGNFGFTGMSRVSSTTSLGTPTAAPVYSPLTAAANVGRLAENGLPLTSNLSKSFTIELQNNLRDIDAIGTLGLVDIGVGKLGLTGKLSTYFASAALYAKYLAGTETSLSSVIVKDGRATIITLSRVKYEKGTVVAQGENQDVMAELDYRALRDPTTGCTIQIDAVEEYA